MLRPLIFATSGSACLKSFLLPSRRFSSMETLTNFLRSSKDRFLKDLSKSDAQGWTVSMGNEAGDLDSFASSIASAWHTSQSNPNSIALIRTLRGDFHLRAENEHAFETSGIDPNNLLTLDDIPPSSIYLPGAHFALLDHNRLSEQFRNGKIEDVSVNVSAIIDHHEDEGQHKDASPRVIRPAGSCSSLVATTLFEKDTPLPPELATLLLSAILIDTDGLKLGGKALQVDYDAVSSLLPRSTLASSDSFSSETTTNLQSHPALRSLHFTLAYKKGQVDHLDTKDLLRRDYKQYVYNFPLPSASDGTVVISAGLSTVPLGLYAWITRKRFWKDTLEFMNERNLVVLGILTTFSDPEKVGKHSGKPKHRREIVWVVNTPSAGAEEDIKEKQQKKLFNAIVERLWNACGAETDGKGSTDLESSEGFSFLKLKRVSPEDYGASELKDHKEWQARIYKQKNAGATRKMVAPLLKRELERQGNGKKQSSAAL